MRTTDVSVLRGTRTEETSPGRQAKAMARQMAGDSCPDDCHYCWGPETD
jgi:hypothetical protein